MNKLKELLTTKNSKLPTNLLEESFIYDNNTEIIPTDIPVLNIALSGSVKSGINTGVTTFAGASQCFKSMCALHCVKAYLDKYPDSLCLFYDSEFGIKPDYFKNLKIDTSRVIHITTSIIQELNVDLTERFKNVERGDKVIVLLDSMGNLQSSKEVNNISEGKDTTDMTRTKALNALMRNITHLVNTRNIPMIIINHIYDSQDIFKPGVIVAGGRGINYNSNTILLFTKKDIKEDGEVVGNRFNIKVHKNRYVTPSKLYFDAEHHTGVNDSEFLLELGLEYGLVEKNGHFYSIDELKVRGKEQAKEIIVPYLLSLQSFDDMVGKNFKYGA